VRYGNVTAMFTEFQQFGLDAEQAA
jgi:hypothetical protein